MARLRPLSRLIALFALAGGLGGCMTLRTDVPREPSRTIVDGDTTLARAFAAARAAHPGQSGVAILEDGPLAWLSRVALADVAERSLDVQYYIYDADQSGLILLQRLTAAADRGVRVRLLIDDNNNVGRDLQLARIDRHPNIEVRVFNPSRFRSRWTRPLQYLTDLDRSNRRMHNKIYAVDGEVAIVGGRNIGDNYFNFDRERPNFRDVDLLVAGPAAADISRAFDRYWNSEWAYPAGALVAGTPARADATRLVRALDAYVAQHDEYRRAFPDAKRDYLDGLLRAHENLVWARVDVVVDDPGKIEPDARVESRVAQRLNAQWRAASGELLIESAYFVPRRAGLARFAEALDKGVAISVLTNSLSSTDVVAVHAGYAKRRRELLRMGVKLYEFQREAAPDRRPRRGVRDRSQLLDGHSSEASLHSKVMVFDRQVAWVGSFNLDPRSRSLNTEIGLFVYSPVVARRLAELVLANFEPERSWQVQLEHGRLVWRGTKDGVPVVEYHDPDTTLPVRALVRTLSLLPGLDAML